MKLSAVSVVSRTSRRKAGVRRRRRGRVSGNDIARRLGGHCRKGNGERSGTMPGEEPPKAAWLSLASIRRAPCQWCPRSYVWGGSASQRMGGGGAKEGTCGGWGDSERPCCSWFLLLVSASQWRAQ